MCYDTEKTMAPATPGCDEGFSKEARAGQSEKAFRLEQAQTTRRDPLDELFRYHPPTPQQLPKYSAINQAAKNFAEVIRANCPTYSRHFDLAMDAIMQARMLANASVALEGKI